MQAGRFAVLVWTLVRFTLGQLPISSALGPNPGTESACTANVKTGPINLNYSVVYSGFSVNMNINSVLNTTMTKVSKNHLVYEANFGNASYGEQNKQIYNLSRLDVFSPSVHMMHNVSYPIEIQVRGVSASGGSITLVYLFERFQDAHNEFLIQLGFGKGDISKTQIFNVSKMNTVIRTEVSLYKLMGGNTGHLMYEGTSIIGECTPTIYLVSKDIYWMSEAQFDEIGTGFNPLVATKQKPMIISVYQNFDENLLTQPFNTTGGLLREKFPSSFSFARFMYNPADSETMGRVDPDWVPGWQEVNGTVEIPPNMPTLPSRLKFLPFYYRRTPAGTFSPVYILVQASYSFTKNLQPANIPLLVRHNIPQFTLRPLVGVRMGVTRIDPLLLARLEEEMLQKEKEEKARLEQERKKQELEAARLKQLEDERKKYEDAKQKAIDDYNRQVAEVKRKNSLIRWERRCVEWRLIAVVNRYFANDEAWDIRGMWKGGDNDMYTCVKWQDFQVGENGEIVNGSYPMPVFPGLNQTNTTQPAPPSEPVLNPKKCSTYLDVILNRNWRDTAFADLVHQQCKFANGTVSTAAQLAYVNAELLESKARTGVSDGVGYKWGFSGRDSADLEEQQSLDPGQQD